MISAVQTGNVYEFRGTSSDQKPEKTTNGSVFFEMDTCKAYMYDADSMSWVELE